MSKPRLSLEITVWLLAIALFAAYGVSAYWSSQAKDQSLAEFSKIGYERSPNHSGTAAARKFTRSDALVADGTVDMSAWSKNRIDAYLSHAETKAPPEAVLRIPRISLKVPVFEGTSEFNLNRGAARIPGTSRFVDRGNTGIAAHRDGFFRTLGDIREGDGLYIDLPHGTVRYQVVSTRIVEPSETGVLRDFGAPMITLVTCYPFYFVGPAPKRFIVHATRVRDQGIKLTYVPGSRK